ncbi:HAMP domain-containing protein [Rubrivivax sp. JA1024]|uniref:sensor histidine kinase n=1 Tax=Rubrivivax sp. JA1026 TaxID=2710888 RepID=UPI0013E95D31|nr:ATP-binding protein [Rubrivivax sp. JA1026]MCD0417625.1 HAMP domain-containing protein [Rubrivivax sp. JA1024]
MRSLYIRIYLTVVAALALFALVSVWLLQNHLEQERARAQSTLQERVAAWGELLQRSLPRADAPAEVQAEALREWSERLRLPMALDDARGRRLGASDSFVRRQGGGPGAGRAYPIRLDDGRTLWVLRPQLMRGALPRPDGDPGAAGDPGEPGGPGGPGDAGPGREGPRFGGLQPRNPWLPPGPAFDGLGLAALLVVLFAAVAAGAYPVVRRLTRRLEALKRGVEAFGAGHLQQRVAEDGRDEVAALGASFNRAASRIEALLRSHQSLLANASHELRSPLARLKMAVSMADEATPEQREALRREIDTNIAELDALVEEVLLASRLDAAMSVDRRDPVDLLAVAAEEAARVQATAQGEDLRVAGDERLIRRAVRNLLENARRYGGDEVEAQVVAVGGQAELRVADRGPGVPEAYRERIFEPFFRLPGHAEREGGVGLGLALVRQIAERHGGSVRCTPRDGGGSCFTLSLPLSA